MGGVEADGWPFLCVCMPMVFGGAPLGAICGSYLHWRVVLMGVNTTLGFL